MLFFNDSFSIKSWKQLFYSDIVNKWLKIRLLINSKKDLWFFRYRVVPYKNNFFFTSPFDRNLEYFTYLSFDSLFFASFLYRRLQGTNISGGISLDYCCGMGILSFIISNFYSKVIGIDVNSAAIQMAELNSSINYFQNCFFYCRNSIPINEMKYD